MIEWSGGLNPSAVAGKLSVTRLTHNNCTGINASGMPSSTVKKMLVNRCSQHHANSTKGGERVTYLTTSPIFEETILVASVNQAHINTRKKMYLDSE